MGDNNKKTKGNKMIQYKQLKKLICDWVRENYGKEEMMNPSWDIKSLAIFLEQELYNGE